MCVRERKRVRGRGEDRAGGTRVYALRSSLRAAPPSEKARRKKF